ncbi:MAG: hypothetical protein HDT36_03950 [Clostridiales bacterium]|nr:hypothetical protein [Clostridiales bacterium]
MPVNEKTSKIVRTAYGCTFGVYTVVVGALILWQVLSIYHAGEAGGVIYSREIVGASISLLSPALWLWFALMVLGFVIWEIFLVNEKLPKLDVRYTLHILKKRLPNSLHVTKDSELKGSYKAIRAEEQLIEAMRICCLFIGFAGFIYSVAYLANPSNFPKADVTHEMLNMVKNIFPWVLVTMAFAIGICVYEGISAKKQMAHVKVLIAASKKQNLSVSENGEKKFFTPIDGFKEKASALYIKLQSKAKSNKFCAFLLWICNHRILVSRVAVCVVAVVFIIVGIVNGSAREVMLKAINICTECIGLG